MRLEFQKAIIYNEDLSKVNTRLINEAKSNYDKVMKRINDDYQSALLIRAGLNEPAGTQIHKLSKAYYDSYRKNNLPKETDNGSDKTIAELLELEADEIEQTLEIKEVLDEKDDGKDGSDNE